MFQGVLGKEKREDTPKRRFFADFNLDICITKINSLTRGYDLLDFYYFMPKEKETTEYRRMITGDLQSSVLRECFSRYAASIEKVKKQEKNSTFSQHSPEKTKWHADALYGFSHAVEELYHDLQQAEGLSAAMQELSDYIGQYLGTPEYKEWKTTVEKVHEKLDEQPVFFVVQKNKVMVEENPEKETFEEKMTEAFRLQTEFRLQADRKNRKKPYEEMRPISVLEEMMAERLIRSTEQKKTLDSLMKVKPEEKLLQLAYDIQFYLGFFTFLNFMKEKGYEFCIPKEGSTLHIEKGYDAAMAVKSDEPVISNDFQIEEEERFFVITGANGGGKTTFARMIGQILYFSKMGLMVPCEQAVIPHFTDILSHFSDEESEKSGRGKLVEELERLRPMMNEQAENQFVILNELFTTAATLDAGIMGKRVIDYFVSHHCYGIYVTHIRALAEEKEGIVSMVAELLDDHHTRTFKIQRKPASEGEYEDSLITKYHMTYEKMMEVMQDGR